MLLKKDLQHLANAVKSKKELDKVDLEYDGATIKEQIVSDQLLLLSSHDGDF